MPKPDSAPKLKKSEIVAENLRQFILDQKLGPGDRLPTEDQLAELFGVSRISVREATKALGFLGIIDAAPRRGLTVGNLSMERISKYLGFYFSIANLPVEELIETRLIIETGSLDGVARRMAEDPAVYQELDEINSRLKKVSRKEDWINHDATFHCQLVAASGLNALVAFNELVQLFFRRMNNDFPRKSWPSGIRSHQKIINALRDGDVTKADQLLRVHIQSHRASAHPAR